nr:probable calcium-binding protein CML23 [Ziziphus jujuba var. spinosa]
MEIAGGGCKGRKPRKLSSSLDVSNSGFAAMEVSNQFKKIFEVIDVNGDGKISPLELSEVLLCLGYEKSIATKEAEGIVREMDCNGDGFLDMDEFMDAMEGNECGNDQEDHLRDAFYIFDSDRNGKISAQELQRVLVKLGCNKCSLQECRQMIKGVDKNGDGFVDFEEFQLMMTGGAS